MMRKLIDRFKNEEGSVIVVTLLILSVVTIIGVSATTTTTVEQLIASNDQLQKIAFYAAEAGRGYVTSNLDLYGPDNITETVKHFFPNDTNPYVAITTSLPTATTLNTTQSFNGEVEYAGPTEPPRGSGYEVGKFKAHRYQMICNGYGPRNTTNIIQAGFYRIGF